MCCTRAPITVLEHELPLLSIRRQDFHGALNDWLIVFKKRLNTDDEIEICFPRDNLAGGVSSSPHLYLTLTRSKDADAVFRGARQIPSDRTRKRR